MSRVRRWTPNAAVARSRRHIVAAIERLQKVAREWEDADNSIMDRAEGLIRDLDSFALEIQNDIRERIAAGEQIGI